MGECGGEVGGGEEVQVGGRRGEVGWLWEEEGRRREGDRRNHGAFPWGELHFVTTYVL